VPLWMKQFTSSECRLLLGSCLLYAPFDQLASPSRTLGSGDDRHGRSPCKYSRLRCRVITMRKMRRHSTEPAVMQSKTRTEFLVGDLVRSTAEMFKEYGVGRVTKVRGEYVKVEFNPSVFMEPPYRSEHKNLLFSEIEKVDTPHFVRGHAAPIERVLGTLGKMAKCYPRSLLAEASACNPRTSVAMSILPSFRENGKMPRRGPSARPRSVEGRPREGAERLRGSGPASRSFPNGLEWLALYPYITATNRNGCAFFPASARRPLP